MSLLHRQAHSSRRYLIEFSVNYLLCASGLTAPRNRILRLRSRAICSAIERGGLDILRQSSAQLRAKKDPRADLTGCYTGTVAANIAHMSPRKLRLRDYFFARGPFV